MEKTEKTPEEKLEAIRALITGPIHEAMRIDPRFTVGLLGGALLAWTPLMVDPRMHDLIRLLPGNVENWDPTLKIEPTKSDVSASLANILIALMNRNPHRPEPGPVADPESVPAGYTADEKLDRWPTDAEAPIGSEWQLSTNTHVLKRYCECEDIHLRDGRSILPLDATDMAPGAWIRRLHPTQ